MPAQIPLPDASQAPDSSDENQLHEIAPDLAYKRLMLVNVVYIGARGASGWVLVDTGVPGSAGAIESAAAARFGEGNPPAAIVMTHGHFDHVGALETLAEKWNVPVYAHSLEVPYLSGSASYPPPDPSVGGGIMSLLSPLYPRGPVNVGARLRLLPKEGTIPELPGWRWIHVPGHTPGQIALWRDSDRALISADACITTRQESAYAVATQSAEMHGPPMYFTQDWVAARESVARLAALEPELLISGHGRPMQGTVMRAALYELAARFDEVAVPQQGRYVEEPTRAEDGSAYDG